MKSFKAILLKECRHIYRDYKTLFFIFLMPIVLVLLFGYTIRNEINNADFAVLDNSKSVTSRQIINNLKSSDYFSLKSVVQTSDQIEEVFKRYNVRLLIVFPDDFEQKYLSLYIDLHI